MNRIVGYRKMIGLTQKEMAKRLNISEGTYRNKEKGKVSFKDGEMKIFFDLVHKELPVVTINDIFFTNKPT
ncbi:helix-turn-helix domain-containing protein [Priestia megaterium]|nr:helix-turn-helix domain-containing protein [Priestia megaterium]